MSFMVEPQELKLGQSVSKANLRYDVTEFDPIEYFQETNNELFEQFDNKKDNNYNSASVIIYEFDSVIATQADKLFDKPISWLNEVELNTLQLLFGGQERIDILKNHFNTMKGIKILKNEEKKEDNTDLNVKQIKNKLRKDKVIMLFCLTQLYAKTIIKLFMKIGIEEYFESRFGTKKLSHVIGYESKIVQDAQNKKQLVLLKLIKLLGKNHEDILYIGNDKDVIQHLNQTNTCQAYFVKTKGMIINDIENIQKIYSKNE